MKIITTIEEMQSYSSELRANGKSVGFVPTMGALHDGHLSLIRESATNNDITIVSIFVNPTQFAANEDLDKYPRTLERDAELSRANGADIIFAPSADEMYPKSLYVGDGVLDVPFNTACTCSDSGRPMTAPTSCTYVEVHGLTQGLCGKSRPTHFRGVTTVVAKLFNIVQPRRAYFGQKDAQQLAVISKMVADLNIPVEIIPCPIVRESDGLAMSSRNVYLSPAEREQASTLYEALTEAETLIKSGERSAEAVKERLTSILNTANLGIIDYVEIVDFHTLQPIATIKPPTLIALAVKFGNTRLIDNVLI